MSLGGRAQYFGGDGMDWDWAWTAGAVKLESAARHGGADSDFTLFFNKAVLVVEQRRDDGVSSTTIVQCVDCYACELGASVDWYFRRDL